MSFRSATCLIRSSRAGAEGFLRDVQAAISSVNRNLPLAEIRTLHDAYQKSMAATSFALVLLVVAGGMGLLLGAIGIYGAIAYLVSQRAGEIGVRLALGAQPWQVRRQFIREGLTLAIAGIGTGLVAAVVLTRLMSSLLFGITRLDPMTYTLMVVIVMVVAVAAAYLPARRASRSDPVDVLRAG